MKSVRVAIFAVLAASKLSAGVYNYVELNTGSPPLFGIVHPPGFTSAGGALDIPVCVAPGDEEVLPALQAAIATWNLQIGITANCDRCRCAESAGSVRPLGVSLESVFLHELGHVLGLDHVNLILAGTSTSFTNAVGTTFVNDGSDNTRGLLTTSTHPCHQVRIPHGSSTGFGWRTTIRSLSMRSRSTNPASRAREASCRQVTAGRRTETPIISMKLLVSLTPPSCWAHRTLKR